MVIKSEQIKSSKKILSYEWFSLPQLLYSNYGNGCRYLFFVNTDVNIVRNKKKHKYKKNTSMNTRGGSNHVIFYGQI